MRCDQNEEPSKINIGICRLILPDMYKEGLRKLSWRKKAWETEGKVEGGKETIYYGNVELRLNLKG